MINWQLKNLLEYFSKKQIQGYHQPPGSVVFLIKPVVLLLLILLCFVPLCNVAHAQAIPAIITDLPQLNDFPYLSIIFKIHDVNGQPVQQINREQITIYEDNNAVDLQDLTVNYGGVHFILAINADRQLGLRDSNGISTFEYLMNAIDNWQTNLSPSDQDLWSFMVNQGKSITLLDNSDTWYGIVKAYQPEMRNAVRNLTSLSTSIDLAKSYSKSITHDQVMLYITPVPTNDDLDELIAIRQGAIASGMHINIWMIGNENDLNSNRGQALCDLAKSTGGSFFLFPEQGAIPNPQNYLDPYGTFFKASYLSGITTSGRHSVSIGLKNETQDLRSDSQEFNITVLPPNPIFLSPPIEIVRTIRLHDMDSGIYPLDIRTIKVMIEFQDQHPRNLRSLQLYQDGILVAEQTAPPFGSLTWDVSGITETSMVNLQAKLEDEIGLSASSAILPVNVVVEYMETEDDNGVSAWKIVKYILLGLIAIIISGTIIFFLVRGHKDQKNNKAKPIPDKISSKQHSLQMIDQANLAILTWMDKDNHPKDKKPIYIQLFSQVIGRDPHKSDIIIEDKSVDMAHAKIEFDPKQGFRLSDLGSVAGTWVNYAPVSQFGVILANLDLIHFGRVAFRFTLGYTSNLGINRSKPTKEFDAKS
jgi:hypothetical protein